MSIEKIFLLANFTLINVYFAILWLFYFYFWLKKGSIKKIFSISLTSYVIIVSGLNAWRAYLLYTNFKSSPLAKYFLPPYSNYYYDLIWRSLSFYFYSLVAGLALYLLLIFLHNKFKYTRVNMEEIKLFSIGAVLVGWTNLISYLGLIVISMFLVLIFMNFFKSGKGKNLTITPFVILAVIIILLVGYNSCSIFRIC